jgi:hypothetical protein
MQQRFKPGGEVVHESILRFCQSTEYVEPLAGDTSIAFVQRRVCHIAGTTLPTAAEGEFDQSFLLAAPPPASWPAGPGARGGCQGDQVAWLGRVALEGEANSAVALASMCWKRDDYGRCPMHRGRDMLAASLSNCHGTITAHWFKHGSTLCESMDFLSFLLRSPRSHR